MFGSGILEVAIGIIFVFVLISIICAAIREGIEAKFKSRAAYLEYGIRELLHDKGATGLAASFFKHPLIYSLFSGDYKAGPVQAPPVLARGGNLPSYIPARNFAVVLMDIAARGAETDVVSSDPNSPIISLESIRTNILNIKNEAVQRVVLTALDSAEGDLNRAQANLQAWYDSAMDRVSGRYKRSSQWIIFFIGLFMAVALNINAITIIDFLYRNDTAREALVARAETAATDTAFLRRSYEQARSDLAAADLPIGWSKGWGAPRRGTEPNSVGIWNDGLAPLLGWFVIALAATLGAPFWFDPLNKVMVIRSTVKPHEKSPEEASEDRQQPKPKPRRSATEEEATVRTRARELVPAGAPAVQPGAETPSPRDTDSNLDGCDVEITEFTSDEDLPAAEGGVA